MTQPTSEAQDKIRAYSIQELIEFLEKGDDDYPDPNLFFVEMACELGVG